MKRILWIAFILSMDIYMLLYMGLVLELPFQSVTIRTFLFGLFVVLSVFGFLSSKPKDRLGMGAAIGFLLLALFEIIIQGSRSSNLLYELFFPITFLVSYYILIKDRDSKYFDTITIVQQIAGVVFSLVFCYAFFYLGRIQGIYKSACYFSCFFIPFFLLSKSVLIRFFGIIICIIPTLIVAKRGPFIALTLAIITYFFIRYHKNEHRFRYLIIAVAAVIVAYSAINRYVLSDIDVSVIERVNSLNEDEGSGRIDIYKLFIDAIEKNSFTEAIIGHGVYKVYTNQDDLSAHNDFIELFWDYGIIGFIVYCAFYLMLIKKAKKIKKVDPDIYPAFCSSIVLFFSCSMVTNLVFVPSYVAICNIFWGLCISRMANLQYKGDIKIVKQISNEKILYSNISPGR